MTKKHVGRKTEKGRFLKSYTLYDTCNKCPLRNYIDLVCNDNVDALIVEGAPSKEVLQQTRMNLIIEFSELSGNTQTREVNNAVQEMYSLRSQIEGIRISTNLIISGQVEKAIEFLSTLGLTLNSKDPVDKIIKRINGFAKSKIMRYEKAESKYLSLTTGEGEKITAQHYNEQLASLSKHNGFRLDQSLTLAEYAAYLKDYSRFIEQQEHGK